MYGSEMTEAALRERPVTSRQIRVGDVPIGGGAQVAVQSMTNTTTYDVEATVQQGVTWCASQSTAPRRCKVSGRSSGVHLCPLSLTSTSITGWHWGLPTVALRASGSTRATWGATTATGR